MMESIIKHLASSSQSALEGSFYYKRDLHIVGDYKLTFIADIVQNYVKFTLEFLVNSSGKKFSISTDTLYSYNVENMAKATVEFLLHQLLYKVYNDPNSWDDSTLIKELQDRFKETFGISAAII